MEGFISAILTLMFISSWETVSGVKIDTTPIKFDGGLAVTAVNISCTPDSPEKIREIVAIQIVKGEQQMASVLKDSVIGYGSDFASVLMIDGHIDSEVSKSYLRLTMPYLLDSNAGKYICLLYYVDHRNFMVEESDENILTVKDTDFKSYLKYLIKQNVLQDDMIKSQTLKLKEQEQLLKSLEIQVENKESSFRKQFLNLEYLTSNHSLGIAALKNKDEIVTAFTAGYGRHDAFQIGDVVIFDQPVITNEGVGYDKRTGMFTAPRKGLYVFHLSIMTFGKGNYIQVEIQVNKKRIARTLSLDEKDFDQSSVSCVVKLKVGDVVRTIIGHVSPIGIRIYHYPWSLFTGYIIKAL